MENKLVKVEEKVKQVLIEDKLSREDDCYLIFKYIQKFYPNEATKTFEQVMKGAKENGISFASITRARRKLQRKHPFLSNKNVSQARNTYQKDYKEYARI